MNYLTLSPSLDLTERHGTPTRGSFATLDRYLALLEPVGIDDPANVRPLRDLALRLREKGASKAKIGDPTERVLDDLIAGKTDEDDALRVMGKRAAPEEARDAERRRRDDADELVRKTLLRAVRLIHDIGDGWLDLLRPLAARAVERRDAHAWKGVHDLAAFLRDPSTSANDPGIYALAAAMPDALHDGPRVLYQFGDAGRGVYLWRVEQSEGIAGAVRASAGPTPISNDWSEVGYDLTDAVPWPTIDDIAAHPEWRPGIYSAQEVITNQATMLDAQEREIARLRSGASMRGAA